MFSKYVLVTPDSVSYFRNTSDAFRGYEDYIRAYTKRTHRLPVTRVVIDKETGEVFRYGDSEVAELHLDYDSKIRAFLR